MNANSKSTATGLAALIVVLAAALGGCAESVANEAAGNPFGNRNAITHARMVQPRMTVATLQEPKSAPLMAHSDVKHATHPIATAAIAR